MEFMEGRVFKDPRLPKVPRSERKTCWLALMEVLARLHNVDFRSDEVGLKGYGREGGYFQRQIRTFAKVSKVLYGLDLGVVPFHLPLLLFADMGVAYSVLDRLLNSHAPSSCIVCL